MMTVQKMEPKEEIWCGGRTWMTHPDGTGLPFVATIKVYEMPVHDVATILICIGEKQEIVTVRCSRESSWSGLQMYLRSRGLHPSYGALLVDGKVVSQEMEILT